MKIAATKLKQIIREAIARTDLEKDASALGIDQKIYADMEDEELISYIDAIEELRIDVTGMDEFELMRAVAPYGKL
tara:strand:+ start:341 stop:568 length:228 start_codon:yes stop_codon:yes gene_type:complete